MFLSYLNHYYIQNLIIESNWLSKFKANQFPNITSLGIRSSTVIPSEIQKLKKLRWMFIGQINVQGIIGDEDFYESEDNQKESVPISEFKSSSNTTLEL